jgi:protein-S-isoprenylcysteine O-methyltransferase Ste14
MYVKLARREEKEVLAEFGEKYKRYMVSTPGFLPRLSRHSGLKRA